MGMCRVVVTIPGEHGDYVATVTSCGLVCLVSGDCVVNMIKLCGDCSEACGEW